VHFGGSLWDEEGTFELEKKVKTQGNTHTHNCLLHSSLTSPHRIIWDKIQRRRRSTSQTLFLYCFGEFFFLVLTLSKINVVHKSLLQFGTILKGLLTAQPTTTTTTTW
jgi:hypothetical protein